MIKRRNWFVKSIWKMFSMAFFQRNKDKKIENNESKEENMSKFQGNKNSLNYTKVQQAFNKAKGKNNKTNAVKDNLNNFSKEFEKLSNDAKQEELKSKKFQKLYEDIISLNNNELTKIISLMEEQKELSEYEQLSKHISELSDKLDNIEKENAQSQEDIAEMARSKNKIDNIAKVIDESFLNKIKTR